MYGCSVVRGSRSLPWKVGQGDYTVTTIEQGEEMAGPVDSGQKSDCQWLICDPLAVDGGDALHATLIAVVNVAHAAAIAADADSPIRKVAVVAMPVMEPVLRTLDFARDAYDFPVMVHILDRSIAKRDVAPSRWCLSANH